jgi:hypothetical protein
MSTYVIDEYMRELPVQMTEEQVADAATEAAYADGEGLRLKDELDGVKAQMTGLIKRWDAKRKARLEEVRTRLRPAEVRVERHLLMTRNQVIDVRTDTGEPIAERKATDEDRQLVIDQGGFDMEVPGESDISGLHGGQPTEGSA